MVASVRASRNGRARFGLGLFALAMMAWSGVVFAQAKSPDTVTACMIDEPPWGDSSDPRRGIYPEVFEHIAKLADLAIDYSPTPLARTLDELESGNCSFTITSWADGRSSHVIRGQELATIEYGAALRKGLELSGYDGLHGMTIALPRGLMIGDPFDHDPLLHKVPVYGYERAMAMVEGGHADGAIGSLLTLRRIMRLHGSADRFGRDLVLARVELALQMNKAFALTPAAQKLNQAVATLRNNGLADRIIRRHFDVGTE